MTNEHCSEKIKSYRKEKSELKKQSLINNPHLKQVKRMIKRKFYSDIKRCYNWALQNKVVGKSEELDTCFVVGYNSKGEQDFYEFSHKKKDVPALFGQCLRKLQGLDYQYHPELKNFFIDILISFKVRRKR